MILNKTMKVFKISKEKSALKFFLKYKQKSKEEIEIKNFISNTPVIIFNRLVPLYVQNKLVRHINSEIQIICVNEYICFLTDNDDFIKEIIEVLGLEVKEVSVFKNNLEQLKEDINVKSINVYKYQSFNDEETPTVSLKKDEWYDMITNKSIKSILYKINNTPFHINKDNVIEFFDTQENEEVLETLHIFIKKFI